MEITPAAATATEDKIALEILALLSFACTAISASGNTIPSSNTMASAA